MKKHKTVREFLKCAKTILVRKGWCQGKYAVTKSGAPTKTTSRDAAKFCMVGALRRCDGEQLSSMYIDARRLLTDAIPSSGIATFNDTAGRKKKEVLAMFDKAIKMAAAHD